MVIIFSKSFVKIYNKLPSSLQQKFKSRLRTFKQGRYLALLRDHPLTGRWIGHRSINITGDIRAIYREESGSFIFIAIGSHSELYE